MAGVLGAFGVPGALGAFGALAAGSLLFGLGSAFVPVMNAETYLTATAATVDAGTAVAVAVVVGVGQTVGKSVVFLAARRGRTLRMPWRRSRPVPVEDAGADAGPAPAGLGGWLRTAGRRGLALMDRPLPGTGVVLVSSSVGVPPLALTAVAAGLSRMRLAIFAVTVLGGRTVWFLAVTLTASHLFH
jgi:membrane protein DedA with SNARE-associated domain